jgi:hypothetical protein
MTAEFETVHKALVKNFTTAWTVLRASWDHETQTAFPPLSFSRANVDSWLKIMYTDQAVRDVAANVLRRADGLLTVDVFNRLDENNLTTLYAVQALADDAFDAVIAMTLPDAVDLMDISKQDLAVTPENYEHARISAFVRYNRAA